jgi:hypothetical protein
MIGSSAYQPISVVQRRGAVVVAAALLLCFTMAHLTEQPMAASAAPMTALQSAAHGVVHVSSEAGIVVAMAAMLCPDDGLSTQADGVPQPLPAAAWSVMVVALVAATWFGRGMPARHARAPGPTRQALLQRFQL